MAIPLGDRSAAAGRRAFPSNTEGAARRFASLTVTEQALAEAVSRVAVITGRSTGEVQAHPAAARSMPAQ